MNNLNGRDLRRERLERLNRMQPDDFGIPLWVKVVWTISILGSLALTGVFVWAIITLVQHFTS